MENGKYFIKGGGGEGTINDWNKLNKRIIKDQTKKIKIN